MHQQPQRPLSTKKQIQLLLILTILAWATQTLMAQLGYGQTVELRPAATVYGEAVTLKQVARWSDADAAKAAPLADLVLGRFEAGGTTRTFTLDEVQATLEAAGANLATVRFAGPFACTVTRADQPAEDDRDDAAVAAWREDVVDGEAADATPAPDAMPAPGAAVVSRSLRGLLTTDLATRLGLQPDAMQITFNPKDDPTLALAEPRFKFEVLPRRARMLGVVIWDVTVLTAGGGTKHTITATARAWQDQVTAANPLVANQVIRVADVETRRVLVEQLSDDRPLAVTQVVGQQAARDLPVGSVLTARAVTAVPLVRPGQLVTVTAQQGGVQVKSVAKATEAGAYGQTIRVRNEQTKQTYDAVVTGPQAAAVGG